MNEELGGQGAGGPHRDPGRDAAGGAGRGGAEDLRRALSRLEKVVEKLAATASGAIAGRAAAFIDEMTGRLERTSAGAPPARGGGVMSANGPLTGRRPDG